MKSSVATADSKAAAGIPGINVEESVLERQLYYVTVKLMKLYASTVSFCSPLKSLHSTKVTTVYNCGKKVTKLES